MTPSWCRLSATRRACISRSARSVARVTESARAAGSRSLVKVRRTWPLRVEEFDRHLLPAALDPVLDYGAIPSGERREGARRRPRRRHHRRPRRQIRTAQRDAVGIPGLEQVQVLLGVGRGILAKHRQVIENPEGPAMRARDQVALLHGQVVHRHRRQVALERLPVRSVVERNPDPPLGPGVEEPRRAPDPPGSPG